MPSFIRHLKAFQGKNHSLSKYWTHCTLRSVRVAGHLMKIASSQMFTCIYLHWYYIAAAAECSRASEVFWLTSHLIAIVTTSVFDHTSLATTPSWLKTLRQMSSQLINKWNFSWNHITYNYTKHFLNNYLLNIPLWLLKVHKQTERARRARH